MCVSYKFTLSRETCVVCFLGVISPCCFCSLMMFVLKVEVLGVVVVEVIVLVEEEVVVVAEAVVVEEVVK